MNDQEINNDYLAGFLISRLKDIPNVIAREGIVEWGSSSYKVIEALVEKELKKAFEAERDFSKR
jgi:hypothetical protein